MDGCRCCFRQHIVKLLAATRMIIDSGGFKEGLSLSSLTVPWILYAQLFNITGQQVALNVTSHFGYKKKKILEHKNVPKDGKMLR